MHARKRSALMTTMMTKGWREEGRKNDGRRNAKEEEKDDEDYRSEVRVACEDWQC